MPLFYRLFAIAEDISQPRPAGDIQPQPWLIIVIILLATGIWFFTRNRRR